MVDNALSPHGGTLVERVLDSAAASGFVWGIRAGDTFAAHRIFDQLPNLGIPSVLTLEWSYCPACAGIAYEGLCGHDGQRQTFSGPAPPSSPRTTCDLVAEKRSVEVVDGFLAALAEKRGKGC